MIDPPFLRRCASGVTVELRVTPRARRAGLAAADTVLEMSVAAPPVDDKANAAVLALLAETWRLPKASFEIVKGATSRTKTVSIAGHSGPLAERIGPSMQTNG